MAGILKEEDRNKDKPRASLKTQGPLALFREISAPGPGSQPMNHDFYFSSTNLFTHSIHSGPPPLMYHWAGFKENPPPALVSYVR